MVKVYKKRILIVTDFKSSIGGIETYLDDLKKILDQNDYKVQIIWVEGQINFFKKIFYLILSFFNFWAPTILKKEIAIFRPDIVWFHSVSKYWWWKVFEGLDEFWWEVWAMYHDWTLFAPFAGEVYNLEDIPRIWSKQEFLSKLKRPNFFKKMYAQAKFWRNSKIRDALLRWVDKHIVPSEFMVDVLSNWGANPARTYVLPHFAKNLKTV